MAARPDARRLDPARRVLDALGAAENLWSGRRLAGAAQLGRKLAAAQRQLNDVRRQLNKALRRDAALKRQAVLVERALSKTRKFMYRDELTGLANRRLLLDHYKHAAARASRQGKQIAVLFLDLDGFKHINDTLGHAGGDALLQQVAERLSACVRASDTVCRLGGDEFVVLLPDLESRRRAVTAAAKIRARLALAYQVDDRAIEMTVSMGMAVYPGDGKELGELLKLSDSAMYLDKARCSALSGAA